MARHVKSARGAVLDWDALKIKQDLASKPAKQKIKQREEEIKNKNKRKVKKVKDAANGDK